MAASSEPAFLAGNGAAPEDLPQPLPRMAQARAFMLLQTLNARLLASHSATSTLEQWCLGGAAIRARRVAGLAPPASAEQRERLAVRRGEPVAYRRVELACGKRVLSEAENWYVPSRLTPAIRTALAETDTPFGRAVLELNPVRETIAVEIFWSPPPDLEAAPDEAADAAIPWRLFRHRALVYGEGRRPFSEVSETYTREILRFGDAPGAQDKSSA